MPPSRTSEFDPNHFFDMLDRHLAALNEVTATQRAMQVEIRQIHETLANQADLIERITRTEERCDAIQKDAANHRATLQWAFGLASSSILGILGIVISLLVKH